MSVFARRAVIFTFVLGFLYLSITKSRLYAHEDGNSSGNIKLTNQVNDQADITNVSFISQEDNSQNGLIHQLSSKSLLGENMKMTEEFWSQTMAQLNQKQTLMDWMVYGFTTRFTTKFYSDMFFHVYDDFNEMKLSTTDTIDTDLCLDQLNHLNDRVRVAMEERFLTKDLNLHQLLDTYGRPPTGLFNGDFFWPGLYDECLKLNFIMPDGSQQPTRYCLASLVPRETPTNFKKPYSDIVAFKAGVCLPKTCDSLNTRNKFQLITNLIQFNFKTLEKNQLKVDDLYCLPEKGSPLRNWWQSPKTFFTVLGFSAWILLVLYSTLRYGSSFVVDKRTGERKILRKQSSFGLNGGFSPADAQSSNEGRRTVVQILRSFSLISNFESLVGITYSKPTNVQQQINQAPEKGEDKKRIIDLRCLEGIKVICMTYVIMGHVLMCITLLVANGQVVARSWFPTVDLANMAPAFAVNAFFAITGILTTYLLFKQNQSHSFMTSPVKWGAFMLYRYLRIMPMYVVVMLFCKYIAKYTGDGPHWDYGTSSWAPRRTCEQESWLWTFLFAANYKPPLDHCIPSAWYLANDFQFFIVTPIFLAALYKNPAFGKMLLKVCIVAGYLAGFFSIMFVEADDLRPVAAFKLHGFKTYITFLSHNYTRPQYRIPAYLCGLLIGYVLHTYEQDKIKYFEAKRALEANGEDSSKLVEPCWSEEFKNRGAWRCFVAVSICCFIPMIAAYLPFNKFLAKFMVALFMSTYHIVFAVAVGCYILLAATGHGNKFVNACVSASFWKPLAKLSLCVVLINVEVITYVIQSSREQVQLNALSHTTLNMFCIVATYIISVIVYLLFEAPIKSASNHLLEYAVSRVIKKQKSH